MTPDTRSGPGCRRRRSAVGEPGAATAAEAPAAVAASAAGGLTITEAHHPSADLVPRAEQPHDYDGQAQRDHEEAYGYGGAVPVVALVEGVLEHQ